MQFDAKYLFTIRCHGDNSVVSYIYDISSMEVEQHGENREEGAQCH